VIYYGKTAGNDELSDLSIYQLSRLIRSEEITSKQLVELYLERIQRYGGKNHTNAYITVTAVQALKQAEKLDRLVKRKQFKGPLHGLPIAIKDNLDTKGIRTTAAHNSFGLVSSTGCPCR